MNENESEADEDDFSDPKTTLHNSNITSNNLPQLCLICKVIKSNIIAFKSLEEFVSYLKHFFDRSDIEAKYVNSKKEFNDYYTNYTKFYKNCEYIFKSNRMICEDCFALQLSKSFYDLFNSLRIGKHIVLNGNNNAHTSKKETDDDISKQAQTHCNIENNFNENVNNYTINDSNPFIPNNLNNLTNLLLKDPNNLNSDMCINNVVMNFDKIKNASTINSQMNGLIDALKKQFFNLQYYSLLQKLFMSYIFKTMSNYIEKANDNHIILEFVLNNIINCLPKSSDTQEVNRLTKELTDQITLLKGISHRSIGLTNALSSNFDELQNNGIKIFKAVEMGRGNEATSSDSEFFNTVDLIKKSLNMNTNTTTTNPNNNNIPPATNTMENLIKNFNLFQSFKNSNERNPFSSLISNIPSNIGGSFANSLLSSLINSGMSKTVGNNMQANTAIPNFNQMNCNNTNQSIPPFNIPADTFQGFENLFKNKTEFNKDMLNLTKMKEMLQNGHQSNLPNVNLNGKGNYNI